MDLPGLYSAVAVFVILLCIILLLFMFLPHFKHEDLSFNEYRDSVLGVIIEYGYDGNIDDKNLADVIRIGYKNSVSVLDMVITITTLFPSSFLTNVLRPKLRKAMLETTCGHSCDICLKV